MSAPPPLPFARHGWAQRNWKWLVPLLALASLLLVIGCVAAIFAMVMGTLRSNDAYAQALRRAQAHPDVVAAIGAPVEPGWMVMGEIEQSGPGGRASLQVPLSGARGSGDLFLEAERSVGRWRFETLVVQVDADGRRIDLLDDDPGD